MVVVNGTTWWTAFTTSTPRPFGSALVSALPTSWSPYRTGRAKSVPPRLRGPVHLQLVVELEELLCAGAVVDEPVRTVTAVAPSRRTARRGTFLPTVNQVAAQRANDGHE